MLQGTCLSSVLQALSRKIYSFSTVTLKIMNVATAESTPLEPGSTDETMNLQDEDNSPSHDESATIRQLRRFLNFFFFTYLANFNRTQMVSSCYCNEP